nr:MAG TPA: hypothetical protein [Bacteriophage sp.]
MKLDRGSTKPFNVVCLDSHTTSLIGRREITIRNEASLTKVFLRNRLPIEIVLNLGLIGRVIHTEVLVILTFLVSVADDTVAVVLPLTPRKFRSSINGDILLSSLCDCLLGVLVVDTDTISTDNTLKNRDTSFTTKSRESHVRNVSHLEELTSGDGVDLEVEISVIHDISFLPVNPIAQDNKLVYDK